MKMDYSSFRLGAIIGVLLLSFVSKDHPTQKSNLGKTPADSTSTEKRDFVVYDGMNFDNKPQEISEAGMKSIKVIYAASIFGISAKELPGTTHLPEKERVQEIARETAEEGYSKGVIDIEHWETEGDSEEVQESVDRLQTVLKWFKEEAPDVEWGYYGEVPIRDYWRAIEPSESDDHREWRRANDRLKMLADDVDILFPSVYTFYDDHERWVAYAKAQISEARRLNPDKPVYVYLWPVYHRSNKKGLAGELIDAEFWELQLETARKYADGIVIYVQSSFDFDSSQPWWKSTEKFISELE